MRAIIINYNKYKKIHFFYLKHYFTKCVPPSNFPLTILVLILDVGGEPESSR